MSVEIVTFGCRLNTHESEIMRSKAHEAGLDRCGGGQYLRGDRGSGAAGAPDHPQASPGEAGIRASW